MIRSTRLWLRRPAKQSLCRCSTNAATEALEYPDSQSPNHHDLSSFLEYAARIEMDPKSTTYVGTHYEYTVQNALERLGMSLKRIGGKSDYGIDLLGTWSVPSAPQPLKVLIQCKAFARKVEPSQARELEGAFVGAPIGWRGSGVLGLLVSQKSATKGVREALGRSRWPMGYVLCGADGRILQMLWNRRAEQEGLEGIDVGLKYAGGDRNEKEVVLMWKGEPIAE
jgi:Required for respiratory growth protein 7